MSLRFAFLATVKNSAKAWSSCLAHAVCSLATSPSAASSPGGVHSLSSADWATGTLASVSCITAAVSRARCKVLDVMESKATPVPLNRAAISRACATPSAVMPGPSCGSALRSATYAPWRIK
jgi:hypothetical protein